MSYHDGWKEIEAAANEVMYGPRFCKICGEKVKDPHLADLRGVFV